MPATGDGQYRPLAVEEDEVGLSDKGTKQSSLYQSSVFWLCVACTVVNVFTVFFNYRRPLHDTMAQIDRKNIHTLRRPSQYIGFNSIPRPSPPIPSNFTNFPIAVAQIDAAQPLKVFETHLKRYMSLSGTVYPDDKKVVVANTISTIVQFRAIDYGMESCEIHISLPPAHATAGYAEAIQTRVCRSARSTDVVSQDITAAARAARGYSCHAGRGNSVASENVMHARGSVDV